MYWIYFIGTRNGEHIEAENLNTAKWIFALKNGLKSLAYITDKAWVVTKVSAKEGANA